MKYTLKSVRTLAATLITFGSLAGGANAALVITIQESGSDIVATYSGSLDLTGLTISASASSLGVLGDNGNVVAVISGTNPAALVNTYEGATTFPTTSFATSIAEGSSNVGDSGFGVQVIAGTTPRIFTAQGYSSGDAINATQTFTGLSFSDLGIVPGNYEWGWSSDTATVSIVPEPSSALLLGLGALGGVARRRRNS